MKHLSYYLLLCGLMLAGGGITGCTSDDTDKKTGPIVPKAEVVVDAAATPKPNEGTVTIRTTGITEYAYTATKDAAANKPTATVLFANGTKGECQDGDNEITVSGLDPSSEYTVYIALKTVANEFFGEILEATITTNDFPEGFTLTKTTSDGFEGYFKVPASVKANEHAIRYTLANVAMYNMQTKLNGNPNAMSLLMNGGKFITEAEKLVYNNYNVYMRDENGNIMQDEETGEDIVNHDPIAPGEPLTFVVGEFGWGESMFGWGEGWYEAMFDFNRYQEDSFEGPVPEEDYWTGYYKTYSIKATEPAPLDAEIEISTENLKPISGVLRINPGEKVKQYCVCVMDHAMYELLTTQLLDDKSQLQWFPTSLFAMMQMSAMTYTEPVAIPLEEYFYMDADVTYHVLVTGMGDDAGMTQCFKEYSFTTPQRTGKKPLIEVKGIDNPSGTESPWEVWFNVKAPNKDVISAKFAANYEREWAQALSNGGTYARVVEMGNAFTADDLIKINSDHGFDIIFSSREDATTRLAVVGINDEGTPNDPDEENSPAVAERRTIRQPDAPYVDSSLFSSLLGNWTATATVATYNYATSTWEELPDTAKCKVTITGSVTWPETLPEDVYALYPNKTKEEVDALYAEFKEVGTIYNSKVRGQNRLLCLGFGYAEDDRFATATPYELFVSEEYSSYNNEAVYFDFGPKWYLQIASNGDISIPINVNRLDPMASWKSDRYGSISTQYLVGFGETDYIAVGDNGDNAYFPVRAFNEDTLQIEPIEKEGVLYYPNAATIRMGVASPSGLKVTSPIVLTRGWTDVPAPASKAFAAPSQEPDVQMRSANGVKIAPRAVPMQRTPMKSMFEASDKVEYKQVAPIRPVTVEEFKARVAANFEAKQRP